MKKLVICAVAMFAMVSMMTVTSCKKGNASDSTKKDSAKTENVEKKAEAKPEAKAEVKTAESFMVASLEALQAGDKAKFEQIEKDCDAYMATLSAEDKAKFEEEGKAWQAAHAEEMQAAMEAAMGAAE